MSEQQMVGRRNLAPLHPAILTIRDHGDHIRVLSYSSYTTIAGRPKVRSSTHRMAKILRASSWNRNQSFCNRGVGLEIKRQVLSTLNLG